MGDSRTAPGGPGLGGRWVWVVPRPARGLWPPRAVTYMVDCVLVAAIDLFSLLLLLICVVTVTAIDNSLRAVFSMLCALCGVQTTACGDVRAKTKSPTRAVILGPATTRGNYGGTVAQETLI